MAERIRVAIQGATAQANLNGPAMFFCGGMDEIAGCAGAAGAFAAVSTLPAMYATNGNVNHVDWMNIGSTPSQTNAAILAWMRVHLMGDDALRYWFYGQSCELCERASWHVERKNMAQ